MNGNFRPGDRVVVVGGPDPKFVGVTGTVTKVRPSIGVSVRVDREYQVKYSNGATDVWVFSARYTLEHEHNPADLQPDMDWS